MHGEYKVPGGKLVVVDLDVVDDHVARVQVSGDFFLEPDSALEAIDRAVCGLPADANEAASAVHDNFPIMDMPWPKAWSDGRKPGARPWT